MTSNAPGAGRILGSLRSADGAGVVRIEDRYDTGIDDLWSALTDPGRVARWYGQVEGDLRPGGRFRLYVESADVDATGVVEQCEPPRRLRVRTRETEESWRKGQGMAPFDEVIDATLTADGNQTILVIEVQGMPLDAIAFYGAGWQIHAEDLSAYVAGSERGDAEARWDELVPPYQELAADIGSSSSPAGGSESAISERAAQRLKRRVSRAVERRLVNPLVRRLVFAGKLGSTYAVLETTGRRTGLPRRTPVANGLRGDTFWLISAHGPRARYFQNLLADPRVRIGLARSGQLRWRTGTARPVWDDDARQRHRQLGKGRLGYWLDGLILRATATNMTTVRIELEA